MKQHLNIQRFWGETENAVRIQIYAAITSYCMVAIIQHETKTELSIYEVLETVSMVLPIKRHSMTFYATLTTILTMNLMSRVGRLCFNC